MSRYDSRLPIITIVIGHLSQLEYSLSVVCFPNVSLLLIVIGQFLQLGYFSFSCVFPQCFFAVGAKNHEQFYLCFFLNNNFACVWYKEFKAGATRTVSGSSVADWLLFGMWPNPAENTKNFIE